MYRGYHSHLSARTDIPSIVMDIYEECYNRSGRVSHYRCATHSEAVQKIIFVISLTHNLSFMLMYRGCHRHLSSRTDILFIIMDLYKECNNRFGMVSHNGCGTMRFS